MIETMEEGKKPHIVVLSGSGISAESGIPTFRDADGLWEQYRVEDVCTAKAWKENPEFLFKFYDDLRKKVRDVQPNEAHYALTKLQETFPDMDIITQNVDDLHERAGCKNVLHLHGEINKLRSGMNPKSTLVDFTDESKWGDRHEDGSRLRPHIVFFGEDVVNIEKASKIAMTADIFIIIGTSLQVYPAAILLEYVSWDSEMYVIDPNKVELCTNSYIEHIEEKASVGVPELVERLLKRYGNQDTDISAH